jgi:hypothetical protein
MFSGRAARIEAGRPVAFGQFAVIPFQLMWLKPSRRASVSGGRTRFPLQNARAGEDARKDATRPIPDGETV